MKKRIFSMIMIAAMALTLLAGCGSKDSGEQAASALKLDEVIINYTEAGATVQLHAEGKGELTYTSADESVATVDANGLVTSVAPGSTTITVTDEKGNTASCTVNCDWAAAVDLSGFFDVLFTDPDNTPAVMNLAEDPAMLDGFYAGLSDIETNQCYVYMPMMTAVPFELALVEVANADDVAAVKDILQARIDTEVANAMNYPMVVENWELNSRIVENGNYVMMVAYEDCDTVVDLFNGLF